MLSSLKALKREILLASDAAATASDAAILALGSGVASMFETATDRRLARAESWQETFPAEHAFHIVQRYPIETVAKVEVRRDYGSGFVTIPGQPSNVNERTGTVIFLGPLGAHGEIARITYTGGYWFDTTDDSTGTLPAGATPLPEDLRAAWVMQTRWFWERRSMTDRTKAGFSDKEPERFAAPSSDLLLPVTQTLNRYRRIAQ